MHIESVTTVFLPLSFPALFAVIWLFSTSFPKHSREKRTMFLISGAVALIVGILAFFLNTATFFRGNFLFLLTGPFFVLILGGLAGIACFVFLFFLYYIPASLLHTLRQPREVALPGEDRSQIKYVRLLLAAVIAVLLAAGGLLFVEETKLKERYGSLSDNEIRQLSAEEIRTAYDNVLFRNHHDLLRGLLAQENIPEDIIEDIYRRMAAKDRNVLSAILWNARTPCSLLAEAYRTLTSPQQSPAPYAKYAENCL